MKKEDVDNDILTKVGIEHVNGTKTQFPFVKSCNHHRPYIPALFLPFTATVLGS